LGLYATNKMICGNYYRAVLITLLVLFGGFLGAKTSYAFGMTWNGTHFASTTPTSVSFCVADYPYIPSWGVYGTGYTNPTSTFDFANWSITASAFTNGTYQVVDCYNPATPTDYAIFTVNSGSITTFGTNGGAYFTSFTYSTTTQYARLQGFWAVPSDSNKFVSLIFYQNSTVFGKQDVEQVSATTTGNFDFSFFFHGLPVATSTQNKVFGLYSVINLTDNTNVRITGECASAPFSVTWEYCGQNSTLLVATSTIVNAFNYNLPISPPLKQTYSFEECGLTHFDLGLCLADVAVGLFQPLQGDIHWENLRSVMESKAPFGYFYMAKDSLGNLSATSTPTTAITIPSSIKNTILIPLDTAISGILWFFFLFNFYKRLKFITI